MNSLAQTITSIVAPYGNVVIFWLGQAGFVFKTSSGETIYIDAYLSDMCETTLGGGIMSKRLMPSLIMPHEIKSGLMIATHTHQDHLDEEAVAIIAENSPSVRFAGPPSCMQTYEKLGIEKNRLFLLDVDKIQKFNGFSIRSVYADHGDLEPEAVGILMEADEVKIYHTGDTSFCPEKMRDVIELKPDIIIPCINGTYGNMNGVEAAKLAGKVTAKVVIPCHFWFFVSQNLLAEGTPAAFLKACSEFAPYTKPKILQIGEIYVYGKKLY